MTTLLLLRGLGNGNGTRTVARPRIVTEKDHYTARLTRLRHHL